MWQDLVPRTRGWRWKRSRPYNRPGRRRRKKDQNLFGEWIARQEIKRTKAGQSPKWLGREGGTRRGARFFHDCRHLGRHIPPHHPISECAILLLQLLGQKRVSRAEFIATHGSKVEITATNRSVCAVIGNTNTGAFLKERHQVNALISPDLRLSNKWASRWPHSSRPQVLTILLPAEALMWVDRTLY